MTLALKYRPRRVEELAGQPHIALVLSTMLRRWQDNEIDLPAALQFTGPRGSGKTSSARIVAAYLNCEAKGDRPCLTCPSCLAVYNGTSQSVIEIDAASHGLVDDIRDLGRQARLSHPGVYRVFIIDEVHSASKEAFSALLKQLEEPPPNVLYILVTTEAHSIPSTITSRCLSFTFMSLSERDIIDRLHYVCAQEGIEAEDAVLPLIAHKAKGGLRDAIMFLEHLAILQEVTAERFKTLWPDELATFAADFVQSAKDGNAETGIGTVRRAFLAHRDATLLVDSVLEYLSNQVIAYQTHPTNGAIQPRLAATLMRNAWELRVKTRASNLTDPILVEALWHLYSQELSNGKQFPNKSVIGTVRVPILPAISELEDDLDAILKGN